MLIFEMIYEACIARRELRMRVTWMAEGNGRGINECFLSRFEINQHHARAVTAEVARICGEVFSGGRCPNVPKVILRVKKRRCISLRISIAYTVRGARFSVLDEV